MSQKALTAGRTESESVRLSTRYDPATRRITSSATPATIQPIAMARTSLRRRSGTSQIAAAHRSSAGIQIQVATSFRSCVRLCAVSSWSDWRRTMRPASGGSSCDALFEEAEPIAEAHDERVEVEDDIATRGLQPRGVALQDADGLRLRQRRGVHEEALDPRALQQLGRAAVDELAREPRDRRRQRLEVRRQLLLELRRDVTFVYSCSTIVWASWSWIAGCAISSSEVERNVSRSSASRFTQFESRLTARRTTPRTTSTRATMMRVREGFEEVSGAALTWSPRWLGSSRSASLAAGRATPAATR